MTKELEIVAVDHPDMTDDTVSQIGDIVFLSPNRVRELLRTQKIVQREEMNLNGTMELRNYLIIEE